MLVVFCQNVVHSLLGILIYCQWILRPRVIKGAMGESKDNWDHRYP